MAGKLSALPSTGEISKSAKVNCGIEWRIPDFTSLMKREKMYFSPRFSFNGARWRMCLDVEFIHLNAGIIRESTIPPMNLEVSVFIGQKGLIRKCAEKEAREGYETYIAFNCLQKTQLLERMSDLLPSNVFTVMCTILLQSATEVRKCSLVLSSNYLVYHCKTCAVSPNMCLCFNCFRRGKHQGHDFSLFTSSVVEICNCGDKKFLKESGFCEKHRSRNQINKSDDPIDLLCITEILIPRFFSRLIQHLQDDNQSGKPCTSTFSNVLQENKVLKDFKEFFLKKEDCDVVIKVQGQEFCAHKAILQARSPVLASTFRNDMKEKSTGIMDIKDCDPSSFSDFLCFIYCGDIEVISQANVFSLFTTADKYVVQDLRVQCLKFMKDNLSVATFCDTIMLALRHSETELIQLATDFFTKNAPKIIVTRKWLSFLAENPSESNELFVKLLIPSSSK